MAVGVGVTVGVSVGVKVGVKVGGGWATTRATASVPLTTRTWVDATHTEKPLTQQTSYQSPCVLRPMMAMGIPGPNCATSGYCTPGPVRSAA